MPRTFTARIEASSGGGAYVTVPFDVEAAFGAKRPPVQVTFDGVPYRGTLARMGGPDHILIVLRAIREQIGKQPGDTVEVTVALDDRPREVEVPEDLAEALAPHAEARAFLDGLSYTHRKEYVQWIEEAKRPETRRRRIEKAVAMLREGRKSR